MGKNISIVDVARHVGVSVSTVSLVMNNRPNVSPDTANAVWEAVKALGYHPGGDGKKRGPKPGPRKITGIRQVGILRCGYSPGHFMTDMFLSALQGIHLSLASEGFRTVLYQGDPDDDGLLTELRRASLDGIIMMGRCTDDRSAEFLRRQACVQILGAPPGGRWDHVSFDVEVAGELASQWLLSKGCRRVACITLDVCAAKHLCERVVKGVEEGGGTITGQSCGTPVVYSGARFQLDDTGLASMVADAFGEGDPPDGIFAGSAFLAAALYPVLAERGMKPGEDVNIVCSSQAFPHLVGLTPTPAVVDLNAMGLARQAVNQLLWRLEHRNEPHVSRIVMPTLIGS